MQKYQKLNIENIEKLLNENVPYGKAQSLYDIIAQLQLTPFLLMILIFLNKAVDFNFVIYQLNVLEQ